MPITNNKCLKFFFQNLKTKLANSHENLCVSAREFSSEKNEFEKEKRELENQNKDNFKEIERLTVNYVGIKYIFSKTSINTKFSQPCIIYVQFYHIIYITST